MKLVKTMAARATGSASFAALCCALWLAAAAPASAAFEDLGVGARGPGMGNAMTAVADDVYALHYNPAGLATVLRPQFGASYSQLYMGLTDGSNLGTSFFGYAHPLADGDLGVVAAGLNMFSLNSTLYRENTLYLSYGRQVLGRYGRGQLFAGASAKYLNSSFGSFAEASNATSGIIKTGQSDPLLSGGSSNSAFDADLGLLYRFPKYYQVGLQASHIPQPNVAFGSDTDRLPLTVKLGLDYKSRISNLAAQLEVKKAPDGSQDRNFTAAAERWFPRPTIGDFGLRGALSVGSRDYKNLSLGLSYRSRRVQIDYGFVFPLRTVTATSGSHRMAITFLFGKPTDEEETLEMLMDTIRDFRSRTTTVYVPTTIYVSTTVYVPQEPSAEERAIAEKLAQSDEAIKGERYVEAVQLCQSVLDIAPKNTRAWQNMGTAYLGMAKLKSALKAWKKAYQLETNPALREVIGSYIRSISHMNRQSPSTGQKAAAPPAEKPATESKPAITMSQAEIDTLLNQGVDLYINRELEKAGAAFEKILEADPGNMEAQKALRRVKDELK